MTNPVAGDNYLTKSSPKRQQLDASSADQDRGEVPRRSPTVGQDRADIERARQRLAQSTERASAIVDAGQAREAVARLKGLLTTDGASVLKAHGAVSKSLFEVAMSRPTA